MKLRKMAALVGALALAVAACGGDDDDDDARRPRRPAATDASAASEATDAPAATEAPAGPRLRPDPRLPPAVRAEGGGDFASILLPKCTGNAVFDQANEGAIEAAGELGVAEAEFVGPGVVHRQHGADRVRHQRRDPGRRRDHGLQQRR